ncbi:hypothetical protein F8S13_05125 [Chloroflexia bacterium SDU3-3]|nr:hypothetical protein F8S13_05125 [Chloroflexia bacterium SDU3-3]
MQKWISIGVAVSALILVAFIVCSYIFPEWRAATRDIAIILVAVTGIIATLILIAILFAILYAVNKIRSLATDTVQPQIKTLSDKVDVILENVTAVSQQARTSVTAVTTTTNYAAEQAVTPVIKLAGLVAGVRAGASFIARRGAPPRD